MASTLAECMGRILTTRGIRYVYLLSPRDKWRILWLEEVAEKGILMGMMPGVNVGVRSAIETDVVLAAITDMNFVWPSSPTVRIRCGEEVIGFEVREDRVKELESEGYVIVGSVAFKKGALRMLAERRGECLLEILPLELPILSGIGGVREAVIGSPSPPADEYIKRKSPVKGEGIGSIIIGISLD